MSDGLTLQEYREKRRLRPLNNMDRAISYLAPRWGARRAADRIRIELSSTYYRSAEKNRLRSDWAIIVGDDTTPSMMELDRLRQRSRDLNRNDPVASGATETMGHNIIGRGLQYQSRLRAEVLGISEAKARDIQRQAEQIWEDWSLRADSANRLDFDEIQFLALRKIVEDGEILALPVMVNEPWRKLRRACELIESDRLYSSANKASDTGIEFGSRGEPKAYNFQTYDAVTGVLKEPTRIEALDTLGRPKVLHVFRALRAGQQRGIPYFAPVLTYFKDLADYLEAEVVAGRVAACLAVFITKNNPEYAQYAQSTVDTSGNRVQTVEPGMINYLEQGEGIGVVDPKRPGDSFAPFVEGVLRMIGASLNLPYELLVKDFSKTNYSSARASLLEGRRMFTTWRAWFARKFCQPFLDLVLEEAFLRGLFEVPDFYAMRDEYTRAAWLGGTWGWVDPVKEVEASRKSIDYGLSTLADEVAGQGKDWEEVLEQQKREQDKARELGVEIMRAGGGVNVGAQNRPPEDADEPEEKPEEEEDAEAEEEREQR